MGTAGLLLVAPLRGFQRAPPLASPLSPEGRGREAEPRIAEVPARGPGGSLTAVSGLQRIAWSWPRGHRCLAEHWPRRLRGRALWVLPLQTACEALPGAVAGASRERRVLWVRPWGAGVGSSSLATGRASLLGESWLMPCLTAEPVEGSRGRSVSVCRSRPHHRLGASHGLKVCVPGFHVSNPTSTEQRSRRGGGLGRQ